MTIASYSKVTITRYDVYLRPPGPPGPPGPPAKTTIISTDLFTV